MIIFVFNIWFILLSVFASREQNKKLRTFARIGDKWTGIAGLIIAAVGFAGAWLPLLFGGYDEEFIAWAADMICGEYDMIVFPAVFLTVMNFVGCYRRDASLQHHLHRIFVPVSEAFVLLVTTTAFITENKYYPLSLFLVLTGVGLSMMMRFITFNFEWTKETKEKLKDTEYEIQNI